ncbi:DUF4215 domain-containing protein [Enhygromyxa salina]|nr:DUF4215 domain-containing protein [Enhygromyxa salina]
MRLPRRLATLLSLAALVGLAPSAAHAIQHPQHLQGRAQLELHPRATSSAPRVTRVHSRAIPAVHKPAFAALEAELGADSIARFDADTGVLDSLIPGASIASAARVPGASGSAPIAERFASEFIARHIDLLAPGASPADLTLVSNELTNGVRTLGFTQHHGGLAVIGGQVSLSFKADRLIAVRSQALPKVGLAPRSGPSAPADPARVGELARDWISSDFAAGRLELSSVDGPVSAPMILPLVGPGGAIEYREVVALEVALDQPIGRWRVYADAASGEPLARESLLHWAELEIDTWRRSPLEPRASFPAAHLEVSIDGQPTWTDADGLVALPGASASAEFAPEGLYQRVVNASGPLTTVLTTLGHNQTYVWDLFPDPEQDAQLNAYVHTQIVKDYVRAIDPTFTPVDLQTTVTVNINDICNAFADQNTLNFFLSGSGCENTALLADVVYHEYGHVAHLLGLQPGVGLFNGGVSEGASDYLSATITGDPDVGVGFFLETDAPIRELDPDGFEWRWPEDTGEVHDEGRIIGGTLWDLRTALIQKYGEVEGVAKADAIWLGGIRRSVDMPSWYLEALITNDDDGELQNGTPDICEINAAFAAHGLYEPLGAELEVSEARLADGSVEVTLSYGETFDSCPGAVEPVAALRWRPRAEPGGPELEASELTMAAVGPGLLQAVIPAQPEQGVTQYQVELDWGNGTVAPRPDNRADEWYEYFTGAVTPIWCSDFEGDPSDEGWILDGEWAAGGPTGGGGDPGAAYEGSGVVGIKLDWPGLYSPSTSSTLTSPPINAAGFEVVRLQYRRWLTVEDGYWDHALIAANDEIVWQNRGSGSEELATVHHHDREWRFHDVDLTPQLDASGQVSLSFSLHTDGGLEFGGWNLDQLCVVGYGPASGGCGDGFVQSNEQCDDGNLQNGDGCSSGCLFEDDEPPPAEPEEEGWDPSGRGCGCAVDGDGNGDADGRAGFGALALLALLGLGRRRRQLSAARSRRPLPPGA